MYSFEWSLQPLLTWLNIFGLNLRCEAHSNFHDVVLIFFGILMLALNIGCNAFQMYLTYIEITAPVSNATGEDSNRAGSTSLVISGGSFAFMAIGAHLSLFFVAHLRWNHLWENLLELQKNLNIPETFYKKLRYLSLALLFILVVVNIFQKIC